MNIVSYSLTDGSIPCLADKYSCGIKQGQMTTRMSTNQIGLGKKFVIISGFCHASNPTKKRTI